MKFFFVESYQHPNPLSIAVPRGTEPPMLTLPIALKMCNLAPVNNLKILIPIMFRAQLLTCYRICSLFFVILPSVIQITPLVVAHQRAVGVKDVVSVIERVPFAVAYHIAVLVFDVLPVVQGVVVPRLLNGAVAVLRLRPVVEVVVALRLHQRPVGIIVLCPVIQPVILGISHHTSV